MVEFSLSNGSDLQRETVVASVLTLLFQNLSKGTEYRARVAGSNSRGMGTFSGYQTMETLVDRKFFMRHLVQSSSCSFIHLYCCPIVFLLHHFYSSLKVVVEGDETR